MLHQKSVVKNEAQTFNVNTKVSADPGPALVNIATADPVDNDRLALALADHGKVISDAKAHRIELSNLQGQIKELNTEIVSIQSLLKDFDLANNSIAIEDIKDFANRKHHAKLEVETLSEIRDELKKKYPVMERDYGYIDSTSESEAKRRCWSILYEGLLKAIDVEPIKQLIAVGVAAGKHERSVMNDLNIATIEYQRLEPLVKQFGLPV